MENTEGLVEQPSSQEVQRAAAVEGSMYGKFKDATSMLNAYKSLEAEFTRKSQRVASLEKELERMQSGVSEESDASTKEENVENRLSENTPVHACSKEDWKDNVAEFFKANPEAEKYKKRMSRILHENPDYMLSPKCLEVAYKLAKTEGLKQPADMIKDQKFIEEYVMSDSRIKDIIITSYIQSLARGKAPKVMTGSSSVQMATPIQSAPRTIREASLLAKKYLG